MDSTMLKVGMLTTWNTQCGIAEYSRYLTTAMRKRDDVDVTVLGSKNYGQRKVGPDEEYVVPSFAVLPWNTENDHSFDTERILDHEFDVLHVQYEVMLYNQQPFYELLSAFPGLKVITYHDNCIPLGFPYHAFDLAYTHREDVGYGPRFILPFGIDNRRPVIKTFGLGRSRNDIIGRIADELNCEFQFSFGERTWKTTDELTEWLRDSDCIVLYYDDVPSAGSSQAARTAIGTRRPVILNDVTWFRGVEGAYEVVQDEEGLKTALQQLLANPVIEAYSWDNIADGTVQDYKDNLAKRT